MIRLLISIALFIWILFPQTLFGSNQVPNNESIEELKKRIYSSKLDDTSKILRYYELATLYYLLDIDSCCHYVSRGINISTPQPFYKGIGRLTALKATCLGFESKVDSMHYYLAKAQKLASISKDQETEMLIQANLGGIAHMTGEFDLATEKYIDFINQAKQLKDTLALGRGYLWLGQVMRLAGMHEKSLDFHHQASGIGKYLKDSSLLSRNYAWMGYCFEDLGLKDSAQIAIRKSQLFRPSTVKIGVYQLQDIGRQYQDEGKMDSARMYYHKAIDLSYTSNDDFYVIESNAELAIFLFDQGLIQESKTYCDTIESYLETNPMAINYFLPFWAKLERQLGNYNKSYKLLVQHIDQSKINYNDQIVSSIAEMETKYNLALKENLLKDQKLKLSEQRMRNNYFIAGLLALSIISFFLYYRFQTNRKISKQQMVLSQQEMAIQKQKFKDLETEKQLVAIKSMVQGQEEERTRIAKELHDGLGSALSSIKLSLNELPKYIEKIQDHHAIEISSNLVDKASKELRRISQDLMPTTLSRFGLITALEDFIEELNYNKKIDITFQHYNVNPNLTNELSLSIYRIVQELINNCIKHAEANEILVQIIQHDKDINIEVEDNGKGFDYEKVEKGRGFENVYARLAYHFGDLKITSVTGEGTSVLVKCKETTSGINPLL